MVYSDHRYFDGPWRGTPLNRYMYIAKFETEATCKTTHVKSHTYCSYIDDIFVVWPHSEKAFYGFFEVLDEQDTPTRVKVKTNQQKLIPGANSI